MSITGTTRGLAAAATSALAIAGLPVLAGTATAVTHDSTLAPGEVDLVQPLTDVSAKPDGQNATMRLTAIGGTSVTSVLFEYRIGTGPWTTIGTSLRNDDGAFALEWNPAAIAGAANVTLRATGIGPAVQDTDTSGALTVNNNLDTVNVTDGPRLDVFQAPYTNNASGGQFAVVSGTSSNPAATPTLDFYDPSADRFAGRVDPTRSTTPDGAATGAWRGVLDITGYDYDPAGQRDEILVKALGATDDAESFVLNRQSLGTVTAVAERGTVSGNGTVPVTVTVTDADGRPVAGAEVRRQGGAYVGQTDADGKVTTTQAGGSTQFYYANATDSDPFEAGLGDKRSDDVVVGQYDPVATSLEADSANGDAFDYDEYDPDDITVQVKDQEGQDFSTVQPVTYTWTFTAFDGTPSNVQTSGTTAAVNGQATIPLPEQAEGGTYRLSAGLSATPLGGGAIAPRQLLTLKAGQAALVLSPDALTADAGGETPVAGTLRLEDATGLPDRPVTLTYAGGDAAFDQPTGSDAATRTVTTGADGSFSAVLDDPAPQNAATERGTVTAATADYDDPNTPLDSDNAGAQDTAAVTFANDTAPTGSQVEISGLQGTGKPGEPAYGTVTVTEADGTTPVRDTRVRLSVDGDSFFTDGPEDGTVGAEAGDLTDLGKTVTVTTDADGTASFAVGIERSTEFDDDGAASDTVTAAVGSGTNAVTDDATVAWSSADPLNGGEVLITRAADRFQESGVLPKAPTTDDVAYDVKVTDQFGNPVAGETVAVTADGGAAVVNRQGAPAGNVTADLDADPEFFLSSGTAGEATPTGTWQADRSVYAVDSPQDADDDPETTTTQGGETVTGDGPATEFYEVDFAASTFTLGQQGTENPAVGDTVIEVYTATDQNGEEIEFEVAFFRTGPGDERYDGTTDRVETGEDGQASYVFSGGSPGEARISAIGYDGGQPVAASEARDTVTFGDVEEAPVTIVLSGEDTGPATDVIDAEVEGARGELLRLFVIRGTKADGNKRLVQIRDAEVPANGRLTFKKADRNGNRKTRYIAKITVDGTTFKSNTQKIR